MTQEQVAANLAWSASKLVRVEGGRSELTQVDLDALLGLYGVTSQAQRDWLESLSRRARAARWWNAYRNDVVSQYLDYVGYEAGAAFIRQFQGSVVPGLLQTPDYARALTVIAVEERARVDAVVGLRLRRQSELVERRPPPRQSYVLDEAVIRRRVGIPEDPSIMPGQLHQIASRAQQDERITVRVIPFGQGAHGGYSGPFTLLEFDSGLPDILYLDSGREVMGMVSTDGRVAEYADAFENVLEAALPEAESLDLIREAAREMS